MVSLTNALQTATAGMNVSQLGLSTISHNLANANTDGYSRQEVQFSTISYNGFGAGVQLESITRYADRFLNERILGHQADNGYDSTKTSYLNSLESIFTASGSAGSLDQQLNTLFNSLSGLANAPDSDAQRTIVMQNATLLADTFNDMTVDLRETAELVNDKVTEEVDSINNILQNIYELNTEITSQELGGVNGANANDLRDERQRQLDALASKVKVSITNNTNNGSLRVTTENGRTLVHEGGYVQLERTSASPYDGIGYRNVNVNGDLSNTLVDIDTNDFTTGSLKGLIDVRDDMIADLSAELDTLATSVMREMNAVHSRGISYPPMRTLSSGNTSGVTSIASDLFADLDANLAGDTFHVSVVDANGNTIRTTLGNGGPVTIPGAGTFSLTDLQDLINNNADVGVTTLGAGLGVTATATTDANGQPIIQMQATNANYKIVLANANESDTNDPLAVLGMNNFFTGTGAGDIDIRSDIKADSSLIATARMRTTDGGLSSLDNQNALALAGLADATTSFSASGNLGAQTDSLAGYAVRITADLALTTSSSQTRADFSAAMLQETQAQISGLTGVNMDEELAQMLVYQTAFQASARMISTIDEMLQILFNNLT